MPISLDAYREADLRVINFPFGDAGDLNIWFAPNALTQDAQERIIAARAERDEAAIAGIFFEVVRNWDMEEAPGGPVLPMTPENVRQLGVPTISRIIAEISKVAARAAEDPTQDAVTVKRAVTPTPLRTKKP